MAISRNTVYELLRVTGLELQTVDDDTPLFTSQLLDSFQLVDLLVRLEQAAGLRLRPRDITLDHLDSVTRIVRFINQFAGAEDRNT